MVDYVLSNMHTQSRHQPWEYNLFLLIGAMILASLVYIQIQHRPLLFEISVSIIPFGIAIFLAVFFTHQLQRASNSGRIKQIAKFTWGGALISAAISAWWIILVVYWGLPIAGVEGQILTVVSAGIGAGTAVGIGGSRHQQSEQLGERDRLLGETTWINRSSPNPILEAVTEQIAEVEGTEPTEIDPLYDHIDATVFTHLKSQDGSPWQLMFYTDEYEIRVASHGTVTVYENE